MVNPDEAIAKSALVIGCRRHRSACRGEEITYVAVTIAKDVEVFIAGC